MKYYIIKYDPQDGGCPLVLKGSLNADWQWDEMNPKIDSLEITGDYIYTLKHKDFTIDYWNEKYIASEDFIALVKSYGAAIREIPLKVVLATGIPPKKSYSYLLWGDWVSMIDMDKSQYKTIRELDSGNIVYNKYHPDVPLFDEIEDYVIDSNKITGKHVFKSLDFLAETICSEAFKSDCIRAKLKCINFIPIEEYKLKPFWA